MLFFTFFQVLANCEAARHASHASHASHKQK